MKCIVVLRNVIVCNDVIHYMNSVSIANADHNISRIVARNVIEKFDKQNLILMKTGIDLSI